MLPLSPSAAPAGARSCRLALPRPAGLLLLQLPPELLLRLAVRLAPLACGLRVPDADARGLLPPLPPALLLARDAAAGRVPLACIASGILRWLWSGTRSSSMLCAKKQIARLQAVPSWCRHSCVR
jgi:hypothetical protein